MAEERSPLDQPVPPPGEAVHLPGPSFLPVLTAFGLSLAICGVVISWFLFGAGVLIAVIAIFRWIRETRAEMAELPLEH